MKKLTAQERKELRRREGIATGKRIEEIAAENLTSFFSMKEQRKILKRIKDLWYWMFDY